MSHEHLQIDAAIRAEWEQLQRVDAAAASMFYFQHILPEVVQLHQKQALSDGACDLLVSLMGFSPETTVLAAMFMQPQKLVVIASDRTEPYSRQCTTFLTQHGLLDSERIDVRIVDPSNADALFAILRDILSGATGRRCVDVTGGKKIMSAVAAHVAWGLSVPVCYVESGAYNPQLRRPEPGSERIVILEPPRGVRT